MPLYHEGLLRVAVATPRVQVGDPNANTDVMAELLGRCEAQGAAIVVFPELALTGYTCGDLFGQETLLRAARSGLEKLLRAKFTGIIIVGLPVEAGGGLYNCAAVLHRGKVLGLIPKSYLPTYKEFYERRWFAPAANANFQHVTLLSEKVPFGQGLLFRATNVPGLTLGVEICEDLWVPIPPSSCLALQGATVIANLSASTELVGKAPYRRTLVTSQSGRCIAAYLYSGSGVLESTTDVIFGGHGIIAENGAMLAETRPFERMDSLAITEIDLERLTGDRRRQGTFTDRARDLPPGEGRVVELEMPTESLQGTDCLRRVIDPHPFVPSEPNELNDRCEEIFKIQVAGLAKRLEVVGPVPLTIGVSGGLDSTLALLVACQSLDTTGMDRSRLTAFVMPGYGSTDRVKAQAQELVRLLGVRCLEADIRTLCLEELRVLGHKPFGIDLGGLGVDQFSAQLQQVPAGKKHDLVFENVQARMRTSLLMNAGFVIGTGDLSELALGWCTYNGDQMNMYNPNVSVPKTLVRFLIRWVARRHHQGQPLGALLERIAQGVITPELLPPGPDGNDVQDTEASVGPYELQDFYLYHFLRFGFTPKKLLFLASQARFDGQYDQPRRERWLQVFLKRFFSNQFKRSCMPDGPKVGTVSLSPRSDWRMPSDASPAAWLEE